MADSFCNSGHDNNTIAATEANVSWNEGSSKSLGRQASNATAEPPSAFNDDAWRETKGASTTIVNINAARTTEASAPTASAYDHRTIVDNPN
jgi:hypothetical protein